MQGLLPNQTILVTGSAGFIGFHTARRLLDDGQKVIGLDNFNDYYDPRLKEDRNKILETNKNFHLYRGNLEDLSLIKKIFRENKIDKICHLAAQAGVRYSMTNPHAYVRSNIVGFVNLLEEAKNNKVYDFIYASSSSVYGKNDLIPFSEQDNVDQPISLYAATKKSNELIAYTYHHLYGLHCTGLRFFTVYGPYGRPDMALFLFTKAILENRPIDVYNSGKMERDFTYIDDIVEGIISSLAHAYPYEIFNLGNNQAVKLTDFIKCIENNLGKNAQQNMLAMQPGDVAKTFANIDLAKTKLNFRPRVSIEKGISNFIQWYKNYYQINV
ncbi:MAG: protein CapI [Parcubacteria group bacterium]|nr:MAG: protein CapI [Parcubacteria group bacterium]